MIELIRSNDLVLMNVAQSLLEGADIPCFVADSHMSAMEGAIGVFPRRLMVADEIAAEARQLLSDAGLAGDLLPAS